MCDVDDAGLDVGGGVEDLAGHVAGAGDDDEFVEDGDAGEGAGEPFGVVFFEGRLDGFVEGADEGDFEGFACDVGFEAPVGYYGILLAGVCCGGYWERHTLIVCHGNGEEGAEDAEQVDVVQDIADQARVGGEDGRFSRVGVCGGGGIECLHD